MQWIKAHLTLVICAALSLLSVVMIVLGFFLSDVADVMAQDADLGQKLVRIEPTNEQVVRYYEKLRDENRAKAEACFAELTKLGAHEPLTPGVFPEAAEGSFAPLQFQDDFEKKREAFIELLHADSCPTQEEIELEKLRMDEARSRKEAVERLGTGGQPTDVLKRTPFSGFRPGRTMAPGEQESLTPEQMAEQIPAVRLSLRRAHSIYCYADPSVFGDYPAVTNRQVRPTSEQLWYAQVALWIQQDVVQALAGLNDRTAEMLRSKGASPWVGNLPVKRIVLIDVGCYVPPEGASVPGRQSSGTQADLAFTKRRSGGTVDVVHFDLDLVVDARMLPAVLDEICKAGFYTPLDVDYEQVPPNRELVGYIYGSDPTIRTQITFEACFLRSKYEQWMPEAVKSAINTGTACPQRGREGGVIQPPVRGFGAPAGPGFELEGM